MRVASSSRRGRAVGHAVLLASCLGLVATAATAQTAQMVGTWRAAYRGATINLVIGADQSYSEQVTMGTLMTLQQGHVVNTGQGVVAFNVETWSPQTMPVYHPVGTQGGYYSQEPMAKPPGAIDSVTFNGPDSMTLSDTRVAETLVMQRVR